jgi:predicted Zn-dependent protease
LSDRNAQLLMHAAPESPFVVQLNAENFEKHGEIPKAIAEYRILLQRSPDMPGIHYRIGGLLMVRGRSAAALSEAQKEFEAELKLNPQNASAEYYLGELAAQQNHPAEAIADYKRAVAIYPAFADALAKLGRALLDAGSTAEAIAPLEKSVSLTPENPAFHLALATAYQRTGRKADAAREFALQKSTSESINQNTKALHKTVSGVAPDETKQP